MQPLDPEAVESPLKGLRVVELADQRGEFCGRLMANLGAEVIKVEPPGGSPSRRIGPFYEDTPEPERSLYWWQYNVGKRGVTLDAGRPEGVQLLGRLLDTADVLIESEGPGGLEALGLGWEDLHRRNQRLIVLSFSDFGLDGPWAQLHGSDLIFLATGGQMMVSGYPPGPDGKYDTPPIAPQMHQSAHIAGCLGTMDVLAALWHRDQSGRGQRIDLSMHAAANNCTENQLSWYIIGGMVYARRPQFPEIYTGDGKYMQVMLGMFPHEWGQVLELLDQYEMAEDLHDERYTDPRQRRLPEVREHIDQVVQTFLATQEAEEMFVTAQKKGVVWAPIREPHESLNDEHFTIRGNFTELEHPEIGRSITYPASPWVSEQLPWRTGPRAPLIGEHNDLVYSELGLSEQELAALKASGTI